MPEPCPYCGGSHPSVVCYKVKAFEYWPDGSLKRVEFKEDQVPSLFPNPIPQYPNVVPNIPPMWYGNSGHGARGGSGNGGVIPLTYDSGIVGTQNPKSVIS